MNDRIDVQNFRRNGRWVKPDGAEAVDVILIGGAGGDWPDAAGEPGEWAVFSYSADELPDVVDVTVGRGGRAAGAGSPGQVVLTYAAAGGAGETNAAGNPSVGGGGFGYSHFERGTYRRGIDGLALVITHLAPR